PVTIAIAAADQAQAAGGAHCTRQLSTGDVAHGSEQDRVLDTEKLGQPGCQRHGFLRLAERALPARRPESPPAVAPVCAWGRCIVELQVNHMQFFFPPPREVGAMIRRAWPLAAGQPLGSALTLPLVIPI